MATSKEKSLLFFDGVLKANPGVASTVGIILDVEGKQELTYVWGLGTSTNNQVEAYALLQGLISVNAYRVRTLSVIDNSSVIISLMNSNQTPFYGELASLIARIQKDTHRFQEATFFQFPRDLNRHVNGLANKARESK